MSVLMMLAAVLSPPDYSIITYTDYPGWALRQNKSAAALIDIIVNPNGKPLKCDVVSSSGDQELAQDICKVFLRKKYRPARLRTGEAAFAFDTTLLRFFVPGNPIGDQIANSTQSPSLTLHANRLPDGAEFADVTIVLAADEAGHVTDCVGSPNEKKQSLVAAVCRNPDALRREARSGPDGRPIKYVTTVKVRLTTASVEAQSQH